MDTMELVKAKVTEEEYEFFKMIMDYTQAQIDTVRKSLEKARDEDKKRINAMERKVAEMTAELETDLFTIETAKSQLDAMTFATIYRLSRPVLETKRYDLVILTKELNEEKRQFEKCYRSLD